MPVNLTITARGRCTAPVDAHVMRPRSRARLGDPSCGDRPGSGVPEQPEGQLLPLVRKRYLAADRATPHNFIARHACQKVRPLDRL